MYQCSTCGSIDPDHVCPGANVKCDSTDAPTDFRTLERRQFDETERQWRLRRALEMRDEGLTNDDIGKLLWISQESVRSIFRKQRQKDLEAPLRSSLAVSFTNHTPDKADLERIKEIRLKADELCSLIDRVCREGRETDLAKEHLEETVMWTVKSLVLPRRQGEGGKTFSRDQREELGIRGEERP